MGDSPERSPQQVTGRAPVLVAVRRPQTLRGLRRRGGRNHQVAARESLVIRGPARSYHAACRGRWRAAIAITDADALHSASMSGFDRLSVRVLSKWPAWLERMYLDTTVSLAEDGEIVHTSVVRWLGLPLQTSVETFTLDPDGLWLTVRKGMTGFGGDPPTRRARCRPRDGVSGRPWFPGHPGAGSLRSVMIPEYLAFVDDLVAHAVEVERTRCVVQDSRARACLAPPYRRGTCHTGSTTIARPSSPVPAA